jgi:hypothetical protein
MRFLGGAEGEGIRALEAQPAPSDLRDRLEHADLQGVCLWCPSATRAGAGDALD